MVISYALWPLLMAGALIVTSFVMQSGHSVLLFNICYLVFGIVLFVCERFMPHERQWLVSDGQMAADFGHTILSKAAVQTLVFAIVSSGLDEAANLQGASWWPHSWPLACQILLGMAIAEFGFYWAHRLAHEWPWLWRFHAIHHSVVRLWFFNTGRFHFVDTIVSVSAGVGVALLAGVPMPIIIWVAAITAYIGLLTHCNILMRPGLLNCIFATPSLHRWHHSMVLREGNRNYGENLVLYDLLFGTYFNSDRRPPAAIGVVETIPSSFRGQLLHPFRTR